MEIKIFGWLAVLYYGWQVVDALRTGKIGFGISGFKIRDKKINPKLFWLQVFSTSLFVSAILFILLFKLS